MILLSVLAALTLLAVFFRREEASVRLAERAVSRLDTGRAVPMLWGLAAALFCFFAAAVLFSTKVLALLGVLLLAVGLTLASLGLGAAALWLGARVSDAAGTLEQETMANLRLGLGTLLLTALLPFLGWLLVLLALAAGIGAVLEVLAMRRT